MIVHTQDVCLETSAVCGVSTGLCEMFIEVSEDADLRIALNALLQQ